MNNSFIPCGNADPFEEAICRLGLTQLSVEQSMPLCVFGCGVFDPVFATGRLIKGNRLSYVDVGMGIVFQKDVVVGLVGDVRAAIGSIVNACCRVLCTYDRHSISLAQHFNLALEHSFAHPGWLCQTYDANELIEESLEHPRTVVARPLYEKSSVLVTSSVGIAMACLIAQRKCILLAKDNWEHGADNWGPASRWHMAHGDVGTGYNIDRDVKLLSVEAFRQQAEDRKKLEEEFDQAPSAAAVNVSHLREVTKERLGDPELVSHDELLRRAFGDPVGD